MTGPGNRLRGAVSIVLGQRKVLQRVGSQDARSRALDLAGLGHALVFWGFLSFALSYLIFIFGAAIWPPLPETILTQTGVRIYSVYLDLYAALILAVLAWMLARRWAARPYRLSFDLTRSLDAVIVIGLTAALMIATLLVHAFYVAAGGHGPEAAVPVGGAIGRALTAMGLSAAAATICHAIFWWLHLGIILGFGIYVPTSKHIHMIGAPLNAYFRSLEPRGTMAAIDLENAERFGAGRVQDFTWKQLLDGYACAVCGRCTDACPANATGKILSPMHIVENLKEHLLTIGHQGPRNPEHIEPQPIIDQAIPEQAIWDCVSCGACYGGVSGGGGAYSHHYGFAPQLGIGGVPHPGNRDECPAEYGTARPSLARQPNFPAPIGLRDWRCLLWPKSRTPKSCSGWAAPPLWSSAARGRPAPWSKP